MHYSLAEQDGLRSLLRQMSREEEKGPVLGLALLVNDNAFLLCASMEVSSRTELLPFLWGINEKIHRAKREFQMARLPRFDQLVTLVVD